MADRIVPIWPALAAAHPNLSFGDEQGSSSDAEYGRCADRSAGQGGKASIGVAFRPRD
jgi:hypothetical protein